MESQGRKEKANKSQDENISKNSLRTFYENYSSELQFIVPWIQYDKFELKDCKNLIKNAKN